LRYALIGIGGAIVVGLVLPYCAAAPGGDRVGLNVALPKIISERGSTRATRYAVTNKIVTLDGKTHIAWLDSISDTMVITYNHANGAWSRPVKVGTGTDNHGGPALLCDSEEYLHIIFGPHHGPFHYCISKRPNDASEWLRQDDFGVDGTYPSAVFDDRDTLHIIYRGGSGPVKKLVYQQKPKGGHWSKLTELAAAPIEAGYTHYHSALMIAKDQSLHVCYDIFYSGVARCAGHLMSRDRGRTWTLADGSAVKLPVTPDADAFFKRTDDMLTVSSIVCDSKGHPWISVTGFELWHYDGRNWRLVRPDIPVDFAKNRYALGTLGIDSRDRLYWFGALDGRFVVVYSADGGEHFELLPIASPEAGMPLMGPNIERPTGHNAVRVPWLLYSLGEKGPDCYGEGILHRVIAVRLEWSR